MLIIENGSMVPGANSYVTRQEYIDYAATIGTTIVDDGIADIDLIKSAQFIDSKEATLKGVRVGRDQPLAFPRIGFFADGWLWTATEIPRQVILAQLALALEIRAGIDLYNLPANPNPAIKSASVEGAVSVQFAISDQPGSKLSRDSQALALLNSLLDRSGLLSIAGVRA